MLKTADMNDNTPYSATPVSSGIYVNDMVVVDAPPGNRTSVAITATPATTMMTMMTMVTNWAIPFRFMGGRNPPTVRNTDASNAEM